MLQLTNPYHERNSIRDIKCIAIVKNALCQHMYLMHMCFSFTGPTESSELNSFVAGQSWLCWQTTVFDDYNVPPT